MAWSPVVAQNILPLAVSATSENHAPRCVLPWSPLSASLDDLGFFFRVGPWGPCLLGFLLEGHWGLALVSVPVPTAGSHEVTTVSSTTLTALPPPSPHSLTPRGPSDLASPVGCLSDAQGLGTGVGLSTRSHFQDIIPRQLPLINLKRRE